MEKRQLGDSGVEVTTVALGSWFVQLLVATTAGYALAVLRPKYAPIFNGLILATLFVPGVVLLVPLYITVLHPPLIGHSLIDTFWFMTNGFASAVVIVTTLLDTLALTMLYVLAFTTTVFTAIGVEAATVNTTS